MTGPVHFIHLSGDLEWQHWRAVKTAQVHDAPILFWTTQDVVSQLPGLGIRHLQVPDWLREHPIQPANVKDYYAYRILREHGGMYLDLDTISLRPAWDLLTADVCVSTEFSPGQEAGAKHNTAVILARKGAPILMCLEMEARMLLAEGESTWGAVGPHLVSAVARKHPDDFSPAPYGALNGWSYHSIGDYYANPRDPGEECRVIHLYSSDHLGKFYADRWMP